MRRFETTKKITILSKHASPSLSLSLFFSPMEFRFFYNERNALTSSKHESELIELLNAGHVQRKRERDGTYTMCTLSCRCHLPSSFSLAERCPSTGVGKILTIVLTIRMKNKESRETRGTRHDIGVIDTAAIDGTKKRASHERYTYISTPNDSRAITPVPFSRA